MIRVSTFEATPRPIIGGVAVITNVAELPTPVTLDESGPHYIDPCNHPMLILPLLDNLIAAARGHCTRTIFRPFRI